jgi:hygromycin-B 7''-O-kinase
VATWPGYRVEAEVLTAVRGKLPTPTPQVHAAFVAGQRARCVSEQRGLGLPELWADQIPRFLDEVPLLSQPPVLLHTEVMRDTCWPPKVRERRGGCLG